MLSVIAVIVVLQQQEVPARFYRNDIKLSVHPDIVDFYNNEMLNMWTNLAIWENGK